MYQPVATHVPAAGQEIWVMTADGVPLESPGNGALTGTQRPFESLSILGVATPAGDSTNPTATQVPSSGQETEFSEAGTFLLDTPGTADGVHVPSESVSTRPW